MSTIKVNTTRFGEIEISESQVLLFPKGLYGFDELKLFTLVDPSDDTCMQWLQSLSEPSMAMPLLPSEILDMHYPMSENARAYNVLCIPNNVTNMTANLKAPVIIDDQIGEQKMQPNRELSVNHRMYITLRNYITGADNV